MATEYIKMKDCEHCLICHKYIGKGNDPAICSDDCLHKFLCEVIFNKAAREECKNRT
jgi:hypothetical protein